MTFAVKVNRTIPAAAEVVYRAWTEREQLEKWMGGKFNIHFAVEGLYHWEHTHAGRAWAHYGRFLALEPSKRIKLTWMSEATRGLESIVEITLTPKDGATELVLTHTNLPDDEMGRNHEAGWNAIVDGMVEKIAR